MASLVTTAKRLKAKSDKEQSLQNTKKYIYLKNTIEQPNMANILSFTIFMAAIAIGLALATTTTASTRTPMPTSTEKSMEKDDPMESLERRDKRQLVSDY